MNGYWRMAMARGRRGGDEPRSRRRVMLARITVPLAAALLGACAHTPVATRTAVAPAALTVHEPLPGLYTAGQPAAADWAAIRARGVDTVIDLRMPGELKDRDEAAEVRAAGLRYLSLPVDGAAGVNAANAKLLHEALRPAHGQVLVHCATSNRAGALLALEQQQFDGLSQQQALHLGRAAGVTKLDARLREVLGLGHEAH
ncbi:MAG: hypothetical protein F9K31_07345 [Dokdonella sp.]|nr:MAG: hypothetical protein F9K31_07345 [Dokdonella sp.]